MTQPEKIYCGTEYGYVGKGCRCAECREASRVAKARRRATIDPDELRRQWREGKRRRRDVTTR